MKVGKKMLKIRMRKLARRHQCSVSGCRSRDTYLISRRDDVNGSPLYMCSQCIKDIFSSLSEFEKAEAEKQKKVEAEIEERTREKVEEKSESIQEKAPETETVESSDTVKEKPSAVKGTKKKA